MGVRKLAFPIALAIVWVMMAALALVDFASFTASTTPAPPRVRLVPRVAQRGQG